MPACSFGDLSNLEFKALWLHHNPRLGGQLPASLAKLSPYALELHSCNFTGALPPMAFYNISNCLMYGNPFACPIQAQALSCGATCQY